LSIVFNFFIPEKSVAPSSQRFWHPGPKPWFAVRGDGMVYTKQHVPSENFTKEMNKKVGTSSLVQTLRLAHGRLEVERLDVLPVLLEKGDKEVDSQHDVGNLIINEEKVN
jgi:hypothetical protein